MALNDHDSALIASYAGTFLFGIYLVIALECSKLLYQRYKAGRSQNYLAVTHVLLLVFISARCLAVAGRCMYAYKYANVSRGVIASGSYSSPMGILVCVLFVLVVLLYDAFLVFRTFVVWNKCLIVIVIPVLTCLAVLGSGIAWLYLGATFTGERGLPPNLVTGLTIFFSSTALLNLVCTGLIAYRILSVTNRPNGLKEDDSLTRIVAVVVESATAPTIVSLCMIITLVSGSFSCFIFSDISAPIIGIVFCSIVIRVSQGRSRGTTQAPSSEIRWHFSENEDIETATSIGNVPVHLESIAQRENSDDDLDTRSTSPKSYTRPPPALPVLEIKSEA
ncbi:hypothetical protein CPB85DRAFT_223506 [Mucidula mucida]|nr:hypothetical protein CPB85DRAFT_223506 [Mucidula mucida]